MFSWRSRRQLLAFLIVMSPLVVIGFLIIKHAIPEPTCFDLKQNQQETGVDCGGSSCISCNLKYPQPIKVFWARAVSVREHVYDIAAEIENKNEFLSSVSVEYEFTLFDQFGQVATKSGKTFLYAQERTLIIAPAIETTRDANRAEFRIVNVLWQEKRDFAPTIIAERRAYSIAEDHGQKQGVIDITLFNTSAYDLAEVEVQIAVLDQDGNLLGINKIFMENFLSQTRQSIKGIWPQPFMGNIAVINVQPRVNIFDPHAILKPQ